MNDITLLARSKPSTDIQSLLYEYAKYCKREYAPSTANNRRDMLRAIFRELDVSDLTEVMLYDIEAFIDRREAIDKPTTISAKRQALRSFFRYCYEVREISLSFFWANIHRKKVRAPRVETFTREQILDVIDDCMRRQDRLMISVLFYTGIRISELLNMQLGDLRGRQAQVRGKGTYDRVVHMPLSLATELRDYCAARGITAGHIFRPLQKHNSHPSDRYISAYSVRERIKREFKKHGIQMHPHQLRHSFAVDWLMRGGDLRTLQIILGHDSIETTQAYLGLTDNQTADIYEKIFANAY